MKQENTESNDEKGCASKEKEPKKKEIEIDPDHKQMGSMTLQSLIFDKEKFSKEDAQAWCESHDYMTGIDETGETFRARQENPDKFDSESFRTIQFKPGITAVVGKLKEEKSDFEKPIKDDEKPDDMIDDEKKSLDESKHKAEQMPNAPIPTGSQATPPDQNPQLDLAKQTNVLLGALIQEVQILNKQIEKMANPPKEDYQEEPINSEPESSEFLEKSIEAIRANQKDLLKRLTKFS